MFAKNTSIHAGTKYTPSELLFRFNPEILSSLKQKTPLYNYDNYVQILRFKLNEAYQAAKENSQKFKERSKGYYDENINEKIFKIGDLVRIKNPAKEGKLDFNWFKPFEVININSDVNATLKIGNKSVRIHNNRLKMKKIKNNIIKNS